MTTSTALPTLGASGAHDARTIALVGLAHGTSHFMHMLLPPLFLTFRAEFALTYSQVGLLVTVFFAISGVGQALSGFLVDRVGARPVLFAALAAFLLACVAAALAPSYGGLLLAAALAGLGNSPFHPVDFSILNQRVSAARLPHAYSLHGVSGSLGWAAAPVFLVGVASLSNWRNAYLAALGVVALVSAVLWHQRRFLTTEVVQRPQAGSVPSNDLAFLKLPVVWWCFAFFFLSTMTLAVVQSFSGPIMQAMHGMSEAATASIVSGYMLASAAGMVAGGFVATRYGQIGSDRVIAVCLCAGAGLLMLAALGGLGAGVSVALLVATGFAVGIGGPSRDMLIKKATPKGATGRVYGTVYSGLDAGFAVSPMVFGALMDRQFYAATLAGAGLVLLLAVFAALGVGRRLAVSILK